MAYTPGRHALRSPHQTMVRSQAFSSLTAATARRLQQSIQVFDVITLSRIAYDGLRVLIDLDRCRIRAGLKQLSVQRCKRPRTSAAAVAD